MSESHFFAYAIIFIAALTGIFGAYASYESSINCPNSIYERYTLADVENATRGEDVEAIQNDVWGNLGNLINPQCTGIPFWALIPVMAFIIVIVVKVLPFVG